MSIKQGNNYIAGRDVSRNIGEIIQSTIPLLDAGLHLLDGSLISGSGSYSAFVIHIAGLVSNYPDLFETEANWQQSVADYGVCGKFVYDSVNNTVRLPKITGFTEGTIDPTVLGDLVEAGLPNITGGVNPIITHSASGGTANLRSVNGTGALTNSGTTTQTWSYWSRTGTTSSTVKSAQGINLNASNSNSIYGNSTTVQPQSIKVLYYIVIATSVKTDIEVDIDEIATDLNGKADVDLSNLNATGQAVIDGQWVDSRLNLLNSVTSPTTNDIMVDLSTYLPNDGYNYEVLVSGYGVTGSTSGNEVLISVGSDILSSKSLRICRTRTRASSTMNCAGSSILPVGVGRYIKLSSSSSNTGNSTLEVIGYRRIGTNS